MATFPRLSDLRRNTPDNPLKGSIDIFMIFCPHCLQKVLISHIRGCQHSPFWFTCELCKLRSHLQNRQLPPACAVHGDSSPAPSPPISLTPARFHMVPGTKALQRCACSPCSIAPHIRFLYIGSRGHSMLPPHSRSPLRSCTSFQERALNELPP